jgi:hypothetical protein
MSDRVAARTQQTADVGRRLEMHAHEMNVDPDLDGVRGDSRLANLVRRTGVPTQRTLT